MYNVSDFFKMKSFDSNKFCYIYQISEIKPIFLILINLPLKELFNVLEFFTEWNSSRIIRSIYKTMWMFKDKNIFK